MSEREILFRIELKPCPFCGRSDKLSINEVSQRLDDTDIKQYTVICNTSGDNAGCGANCGYRHFTKQDAIAAWNKRVEKKQESVGGFEEWLNTLSKN